MLLLIVPAGLLRLRPDLSSIWSKVRNEQINQLDLFERGRASFALFTDYTPKDLQISSFQLSLPRSPDAPLSDPLPDNPKVQVLSEGPTHLRAQVQSDASVPLRLHRIYFPGWRAYVNGKRLPVSASGPLGLVTAQIPPGTHEVEFRFGTTPLRGVAVAISLVSLAILAWIVLRSRQRTAILLAFGATTVLFLLLLWQHQGRGEPDRQPTPYSANFEGELSLLGYHLPATTWKPGETIPVRLYWLTRKSPATDYSVFLHLALMDDLGKVAQSDSPPIYGYSPTTQWEPGEIVIDQQRIHLDETVPPGRYRLLMGLYRPDMMQNLVALQATRSFARRSPDSCRN